MTEPTKKLAKEIAVLIAVMLIPFGMGYFSGYQGGRASIVQEVLEVIRKQEGLS